MKRRYSESQAYKIAHAAGWDAGNRSMHEAGRKSWSDEDWAVSAETFNAAMKGMGYGE